MDFRPLPYFGVDVPTPAAFPGRATSPAGPTAAARPYRSHEVYDAARAAQEAGPAVPHGRPHGRGACGYRPA